MTGRPPIVDKLIIKYKLTTIIIIIIINGIIIIMIVPKISGTEKSLKFISLSTLTSLQFFHEKST